MDASDVLAAVASAPPAALVVYGAARHARATLRRTDGFATSGRVARVLSERAARRSAPQTRPTLTRPATHPAEAFGRLLGRTVRPEGGRRCFARWEDVVMVLAPPRAGKTALIGNYVIDAPGAALVTSTKVDILTLTQKLRAARGPVWVLNPEGMSGAGSTLRWSPIPACSDPARAIATAAYMVAAVEGNGLADNTFWDGQNAKVLRSLLYAAAVAGASMWDLAAWITSPDSQEPLQILTHHPGTPQEWADALRQVMTAPDRTRNAVYLTLQRVVEFMADPAIAAATIPDPHDPGGAAGGGAFDVDAFVDSGCGTVYLLGSAKAHGGMGPLFAALTGLIFEAAKRRSQALPAGRLDPPLSMILDEATNICPVPLAQWASDAGGRGISLTYAIQSPSQLEARWGRPGAETIRQSSNAKVILGGLSVTHDLAEISELLGHRDEITPVPYHPQAHRAAPQIRRVPVMSPAEIRQIPEGRALLLYRSLPPVEIVMRPVWKRRDVRGVEKSGSGTPRAPVRRRSVRLDKIGAVQRRGAADPDTSHDRKDPG
jgi:type IV secretion system protein VirD4